MAEIDRRVFLLGTVGLSATLLATQSVVSASSKPTALVYAGPASTADSTLCWKPITALLKTSYKVIEVGPASRPRVALTAHLLERATLYVQPGGGNDLLGAWNEMKKYRTPLMNYVKHGGHYLGICMGAYLAAGENSKGNPGLGLIRPGDTNEYIGPSLVSDDPSNSEADEVVALSWGGKRRTMYFQAGPEFTAQELRSTNVIATYSNGQSAAMVVALGKGSIGLSGPHPEAPSDWYSASGPDFLTYEGNPPRPFPTSDLFHDLVMQTVQMRGGQNVPYGGGHAG